eukprot:Gb_18638 [translate_table: standard]
MGLQGNGRRAIETIKACGCCFHSLRREAIKSSAMTAECPLPSLIQSLSMALRMRMLRRSPSTFLYHTESHCLKPTTLVFVHFYRLMSTCMDQTANSRESQRKSNRSRGNEQISYHSRDDLKSKTQLASQNSQIFQYPDDTFSRATTLRLQDYLCRKWGLFDSDVARAIEYAPRFVMKIKTLVEAMGRDTELKIGIEDLKAEVETLLKENNTLDEKELFLESIGKKEDGLGSLEIELRSDRGLVAVTRLLERYDFPRTNVFHLIQKQNCLLKCYESELIKTLSALEAYGFSRETLPCLIDSCPSVLDSGYLNKWHPLFSRLKKLPNRAVIIEKILKYCRRFGVEPVGPQNYEENIKFLASHRIGSSYVAKFLQKCPLLFFLNRKSDIEPNIRVLRDAGVRNENIHDVLRKFLNVVTYRVPSLVSKIDYLKSIGLGREDIDHVCSKFPAILGHSVEDKLKPLVHELQSLGFSGHRLVKTIVNNPYVFSMKVGGELSRCVLLLKHLRCRKSIQDKILEQGIIRGSRRVKARVECLTKHGLSHREALKLLEKEPRIIIYDLRCIERKVNFLINDMGFPIRNLIEVPDYLGVNFEKQIIPRHKVIVYLRSRGGLGMEVTLKTMMKLTRNQFYNKYVRPYPDCEKFFGKCNVEEERLGSDWDEK